MHDLMHDLAVKVAGEESTIINLDKKNIPKNTRHVSIDYGYGLSSEILVPLLEANKIRTFLLPRGYSGQDVEIWSHEIMSKSRRLRILDLHSSHIRRVPDSIGKLKFLRYLDLSGNNDIETLPSSIARLQNLLVLEVINCGNLKELPKDFKKLVSLTHLDIDGCVSLTHMPQGLGQLTCLEKLTTFIVSNDDSVSKHYGGLNELNGLNNLRGKLRIENLNQVKHADSEYKAANLEGKNHLQSLILTWEEEGDEISMEGLQPHTNLKKLNVMRYPGVSLPSWLSSLTNLVKLKIRDCKRVKHLQPLDGLSSLQYLRIGNLNDLESIEYGLSSLTNLVNLQLSECERVKHLPPLDGLTSLQYLFIEELSDLEYIDYCNGSNCSKGMFFSSLEHLVIRKCPNLKGWRNIVSMGTAPTTSSSTIELPPFPCLSKLDIQNCKSLTSMPPFPSIEGHLGWQRNSGKPLQETMMMKSKASTSSSSSSSPPIPLSKLKSLWIERIDDLEYLPDQGMRNLTSLQSLKIMQCNGLQSLEGEGFSGLTSLHSLQINWCERLKSISGVLQHCTALEKLYIGDCKELDFSDGMHYQGLRSLKTLDIAYCENLRTLSPVFEHLTALEKLQISNCNGLQSLEGEGFSGLTSLHSLQINRCERLKFISGVLQHCTALEKLYIGDCKELDFSDGMHYQGLKSLKTLDIAYCKNLRTLSPVFEHLTALEELRISNCNKLDLSDVNDIQFQTCDSRSLRFLWLSDIPKLVSLPEWLQHFTTLQFLSISHCDDLRTLPDWIGNLTSLESFSINGCPHLSERCGNNMGVDWPKIAHIPNIEIENTDIQCRGRYLLE